MDRNILSKYIEYINIESIILYYDNFRDSTISTFDYNILIYLLEDYPDKYIEIFKKYLESITSLHIIEEIYFARLISKILKTSSENYVKCFEFLILLCVDENISIIHHISLLDVESYATQLLFQNRIVSNITMLQVLRPYIKLTRDLILQFKISPLNFKFIAKYCKIDEFEDDVRDIPSYYYML